VPSTPSNISDVIALLEYVSANGVRSVTYHNYEWFWDQFIAALETASKVNGFDSDLLAGCYYVAGDAFDFTNAPLMAIQYYQKALILDPELAAAYREIARMYERIGDYDKTIEYSDKALAIDPDEPYALGDREGLEAREEMTPYDGFEAGNSIWQAYELLAANNPLGALEILKEPNGVAVLRALAHCYGALGQTEEYLKTWKELCQAVEAIDFSYDDWFFIQDSDHNNSEIWKIWLESDVVFSGNFEQFEGLESNQLYQSYSTNDCIRTVFEYRYFLYSRDEFGLQRMLFKYPQWIDLAQNVKHEI